MILQLEEYKEAIDFKLKEFFQEKYELADTEEAREMINILQDYTLRGGKRVRPYILYLASKGLGAKCDEAITRAALAMELLQSFFLIHDDIIDQDYLRRGGETPHKIYQKYGDAHTGNSLAILCGDLAYAYANELLAETNNASIIKVFNELAARVIFGQKRDMLGSKDDEEVLKTYEMKTATYTFLLPLKLASVLAGREEESEELAKQLGVAFQLQDDLLDYFGQGDKPLGSDLKEGKRTLILIKAIHESDKEDKEYLEKSLKNDFDIERIKEILIKTGAKKYVEEEIEKRYSNASLLLEKTGYTTKKEIKDVLKRLRDREK